MDVCRLLSGYLDTLASRYGATKFVSIIGTQVRCCLLVHPQLS